MNGYQGQMQSDGMIDEMLAMRIGTGLQGNADAFDRTAAQAINNANNAPYKDGVKNVNAGVADSYINKGAEAAKKQAAVYGCEPGTIVNAAVFL